MKTRKSDYLEGHIQFEEIEKYVNRSFRHSYRSREPLNLVHHLHILTCQGCRKNVLNLYGILADVTLSTMDEVPWLFPMNDPETIREEELLSKISEYLHRSGFRK